MSRRDKFEFVMLTFISGISACVAGASVYMRTTPDENGQPRRGIMLDEPIKPIRWDDGKGGGIKSMLASFFGGQGK